MEKRKGGFWFMINDNEREAMNILKEKNINISGFLRKCLRDKAKVLNEKT